MRYRVPPEYRPARTPASLCPRYAIDCTGRYKPFARRGAPLMSSTAITWIIIGLIVLFVLWIIMIYNGLVALRQRVNQAFSDIDVQTKQRHDLIPNLVEKVKGYAAHERGTLEAVVQARNAAIAAPTGNVA